MRKIVLTTALCIAVFANCSYRDKNIKMQAKTTLSAFSPGAVWYDNNGDTIQAHGGGILFENGIYYWYGEYKKGATKFIKDPNYDNYIKRVDAIGISCYSSNDLYNWKFEGIVLSAVKDDSVSDLHTSKVMERPKVIYNSKTRKYVMWLHVDSWDYTYASAGVAISDKPTGPFTYLGSMHPNNQVSRDMTLFKDDDGRAYHIYSSEDNLTMYISLLSDDYLKPGGKYTRNFINKEREAPAVFKHKGKYYMITSACTGWNPNIAEYAVADSMLGKWIEKGELCINDTKKTTFDSQSTFVIKVEEQKDMFIFMADRWNPENLRDSRYVWLPIRIENEDLKIQWYNTWTFSDK